MLFRTQKTRRSEQASCLTSSLEVHRYDVERHRVFQVLRRSLTCYELENVGARFSVLTKHLDKIITIPHLKNFFRESGEYDFASYMKTFSYQVEFSTDDQLLQM